MMNDELKPCVEFFNIYKSQEDKRRAMIEMFKTIIDDENATIEEKIVGINNFTMAYLINQEEM